MKNTIITVVVVIVGLAAGSYLLEAVQTKRAVDSLSNPTTVPALSESEAKAEFMGGCDTNSYAKQAEYCGCVYDQMRNRTTVNQLANEGLTFTQEQIQAKYENEINYCVTTVYEGVEL